MTAAEVKDQQPQGNTTNIKDGLADRKIIGMIFQKKLSFFSLMDDDAK